jgi:formamidopyrimidine-DNA glycosylase
MPELPEVETVANQLNSLVAGLTISSARLMRQKLSPGISPEEFSNRLSGAGIESVGRRGKHLLFSLTNAQTLIVHLRMSGRFMLVDEETEEPKFTHAAFNLADGRKLLFHDQRHFGMMKLVNTTGLYLAPEIAKLAPEPFSDDFTPAYLIDVLKSTRRTIKDALLDQTRVCGLGNIYASEAMFIARVYPRAPANSISTVKSRRLYWAMLAVMSETIELGRQIPIDPGNIGGNIYGNDSTDEWRVYGREGQPCPNCSRRIARILQNGRSTYYCPRCQR